MTDLDHYIREFHRRGRGLKPIDPAFLDFVGDTKKSPALLAEAIKERDRLVAFRKHLGGDSNHQRRDHESYVRLEALNMMLLRVEA